MMVYLINDTVVFRMEDGALWNTTAAEEIIHISSTIARILSFFIENHGVILRRTAILSEVWEKYGLYSSNNTLNQYISILRRTFVRLGLEGEVIQTIPRVGFILLEHVGIQAIDLNNTQENDNHSDTSAVPESPTGHMPGGQRLQPRPGKLIKAFAISVIGIAFPCLIYAIHPNNTPAPNLIYDQKNRHGPCEIYSLSKKTSDWIAADDNLQRLLDESKITCSEGDTIILKVSEYSINTHPEQLFIANCLPDENAPTTFKACKSIYHYE
jgi:DNA-binding winged helix-turn-helix (wHTH) protein